MTLNAPSVLEMTLRNLATKEALLRRTMDLSADDMRTGLRRQPEILHYSAAQNLAPTILFMVRALDPSKGKLQELVVTCLSILGTLSNLKRKLWFFLFGLVYCDVEDGLERVQGPVIGTPKLLLLAMDTGLAPRMHCRSCLPRHPSKAVSRHQTCARGQAYMACVTQPHISCRCVVLVKAIFCLE